MTADLVTVPIADAINTHHHGLARDELLITRCTACGRHQFPPRLVCYGCSSAGTLEWVRASGAGEVWSFATFHKAYFPPEVRSVPYNVVIVLLDEGPRIVTTVEGLPDEELAIGLRLQASFRHEGDQHLVVFHQTVLTDPGPDSAASTDAVPTS